MKDVQEVVVISSPPRIKRLVSSRIFDDDGNRCSTNTIMDSIFDQDGRINISSHLGGRGKGTFGSSTLCLPVSFEQEVDEESCTNGGCYYNMNRPNGMLSSALSYREREGMNANGGCVSSSTDMCRRYSPLPFIGMCILFLIGIGEMLRKVGGTHGGEN